jgi:hypothetical protein
VTYGVKSSSVPNVRVKRGGDTGKRRAFKPRRFGKHWLTKPAVIFRGQREICNPVTDDGILQYWYRRTAMWVRQEGSCCICCQDLHLADASFEHENGRTAGRRDDRIEIDGKAHNGASHLWCNKRRGSKRTPIYHYPQFHLEEDMPLSGEQFDELSIYLLLTQCCCGRSKASGEPFCESCGGKLSPQQRFDLDPGKADITYLRGVARVRAQVMDPEAA